MSELDALIAGLLKQKPDLSRETIDDLIRQKKEKIGAGYLTDEGAVFLIASDMGVQIGEPIETEVELRELFAGAKEATVKARVLGVSPVRHLTRKDGSPLLLRTMTVYDESTRRSVNLWDEQANLPVLGELKPGDLVRLARVYTKADINGDVVINVGSNSSVEQLHEDSDIPTIDEITVDVSTVSQGQKNLAVSGLVDGQLGTINFTNAKGQPRKALKMKLKGTDNGSFPVVLWGKDESEIPRSVPVYAKARLLDVAVKPGRQSQQLELHGTEGTVVEIDGALETKPVQVRIISSGTDAAGNSTILGVDRQKNLLILKDSSGQTSQMAAGDVMECMPSASFGNSVTLNDSSYVHKKKDDPELPRRDDLRTKVIDIMPGGIYCIEIIILKKPEVRDITTKSGESIQLSSVLAEDDTGQIWIKGWRDKADLLAGLDAGQVVSILGVDARPGQDGRTELTLMPFSSVDKKT